MGFAVTLDGRDIFNCFAPRSGVRYGNPVPERMDAAHWDQLSFDDFLAKPVGYQEMVIAAYRTKNQIEAVLAHRRNRKNKSSGNTPASTPRRGRRR